MAVERTLSIIKPDATRRNITGEIVARFEKAGLRVVGQRRTASPRHRPRRFMPSTGNGPSSTAWSNS